MYNTCIKMKPNLYKSIYKNQVIKTCVSLFNNKKNNLSQTNFQKTLRSNILLDKKLRNTKY